MNQKEDIKKYYFVCKKDIEAEYHEIVSNYIQFYHVRAKTNQLIFYIMNVLKIIAVASIPVCEIVSDCTIQWATIASSLTLVIDGFLNLFRVQEKWHLYRNTNNALLQEQREYFTKSGKYTGEQADSLAFYAKNMEEIIGDEAKKWHSTVKNANSTSDSSGNSKTN